METSTNSIVADTELPRLYVYAGKVEVYLRFWVIWSGTCGARGWLRTVGCGFLLWLLIRLGCLSRCGSLLLRWSVWSRRRLFSRRCASGTSFATVWRDSYSLESRMLSDFWGAASVLLPRLWLGVVVLWRGRSWTLWLGGGGGASCRRVRFTRRRAACRRGRLAAARLLQID